MHHLRNSPTTAYGIKQSGARTTTADQTSAELPKDIFDHVSKMLLILNLCLK